MSRTENTEKQLIILEIEPIIASLMKASNYYTVPRTIIYPEEFISKETTNEVFIDIRDVEATTPIIEPLTHRRAFNIVLTLVNETVNQYVQYRIPTPGVETIASLLVGSDAPSQLELSMTENFLCLEEVDRCVLDIQQIVTKNVLPNTWRQWDVISTPSIIALLGGEDYRIEEWKRQNNFYDKDHDNRLIFNVGAALNYIESIVKKIRIVDNCIIDPGCLLLDAIYRKYPHMKLDKGKTEKALSRLFSDVPSVLGITCADFYLLYTKHLVEAFIDVYFRLYTDHRSVYKAELIDGRLTLEMELPPKSSLDRYYWEIKKSIENGDWVSESIRRSLSAYEKHNR